MAVSKINTKGVIPLFVWQNVCSWKNHACCLQTTDHWKELGRIIRIRTGILPLSPPSWKAGCRQVTNLSHFMSFSAGLFYLHVQMQCCNSSRSTQSAGQKAREDKGTMLCTCCIRQTARVLQIICSNCTSKKVKGCSTTSRLFLASTSDIIARWWW